jgi:hypothetical protein
VSGVPTALLGGPVLVALLLLTPGCGGTAPEDGADPFHGLVFHWADPVPVLSIGAVDGPEHELFGTVRRVALVADSVLGVLDRGANEVRSFDLAGRFLFRSGGMGEGPGEIVHVSDSWVDGDGSIGILDPALARVTRFGADGGFRLGDPPPAPTGGGDPERAVGRTGGSWIVFTSELAPEPPRGELHEGVVELWSVGPGGADGGPVELAAIPWYMTRDGRLIRVPPTLSSFPRTDVNRGIGAVLDPARARVLIHAAPGRWHELGLPEWCPPVPDTYFEDTPEGSEPRAGIPLAEFAEVAPACLPPYDALNVTGDGRVVVCGRRLDALGVGHVQGYRLQLPRPTRGSG